MSKTETKSEKKLQELRIVNWILLGVITLMILAGAGWYILVNQDKINSELLENLSGREEVRESSNTDDGTVNIDQEVKDLDDAMNESDDEDLSETEIADTELGL